MALSTDDVVIWPFRKCRLCHESALLAQHVVRIENALVSSGEGHIKHTLSEYVSSI
jgi:hypothetical protein